MPPALEDVVEWMGKAQDLERQLADVQAQKNELEADLRAIDELLCNYEGPVPTPEPMRSLRWLRRFGIVRIGAERLARGQRSR